MKRFLKIWVLLFACLIGALVVAYGIGYIVYYFPDYVVGPILLFTVTTVGAIYTHLTTD